MFGGDLISFGIDIGAIVPVAIVLILILLHFNRVKSKENKINSLFVALLVTLIVMCVVDGVERLLNTDLSFENELFPYLLAVFSQIIQSAFCLLWLMFVSYRLYHSRDYITRRLFIYALPIIVLTLMSIGSYLFYRGDNSESVGIFAVIITLLLVLVRFTYIIISVIRLHQYKKQSGDMRFFRISYFLIPVIVVSILDMFSRHAFGVAGYAVGVSLLYISIALEGRYKDYTTGFYNEKYMRFISKLAQKGKYPIGGVMTFDIDDEKAIREFSWILRKQIPRSCEAIRYKPNEIVVFTRICDPSPLHMVTEDVLMAVDERNQKTDKTPFNVKTSYKVKKKKETVQEFVDRIIPGREKQA